MNGFLITIIIILSVAALVSLSFVFAYKKKYRDILAESERLNFEVYHDMITGHTNWNWLWMKLGRNDDDTSLPYDFVHFDIKAFKMFNELYDHRVGNLVLSYVAEQLEKQDFILYSARCDNDNFAFVTKTEYDGKLKEKLTSFFESIKYVPGYEERPLYFRCGVVERDKEVRSCDTVADMAKMAQNMGQKINCTEITYYDDEMRNSILRSERLKEELPEAFFRDEVQVYFQPKFDAESETIIGAEALARWNYHGKELWPPAKFIPYIETNSGINMLDEFVVEKVCQFFTRWKEEGRKLLPVSVNLSQREIYKANLVDDIKGIVDRYGVDHSLIEFELTESATFEDREYLMWVMKQLHDEGFRLSMDDFGTGYSSFNLLKDMPINVLKIDKSFVDSITEEKEDYKGIRIVEDIISMVKHLSINCVAEGVETQYQKDVLKSWGCDYIQGYYYSKPIPSDEYENNYLI